MILSKWRGPLVVVLACALVSGCGKKSDGDTDADKSGAHKWNQESSEAEYRLLKAELQLAGTKKPYMVFDIKRRELEMRLEGAIVWNYPIITEDSASTELQEFSDRFLGADGKLVRPLMYKYLFASTTRTPDSILAIVSEATLISPDLMQRTIPSRFQLKWDDGLVLDVRTDVVGKPESKWKNTITDLRQAIKKPFGAETMVVVKMPTDYAITLFRATDIGMPTLILPES